MSRFSHHEHQVSFAYPSTRLQSVAAMNALLILALVAGTIGVHHIKEGVILTELGTLELNNPSPLTIRINNYQLCSEEPIICFKNHGGGETLYEECDVNFCDVGFDFASRSSELGAATVDGDALVFKQSAASKCLPEVTDGFHTYQIVSLPQNCEVVVVGATKAVHIDDYNGVTNPDGTSKTSGKSTMITIVVVCVSIVSILLIALCAVFIVPRIQAYAQKNRFVNRMAKEESYELEKLERRNNAILNCAPSL